MTELNGLDFDASIPPVRCLLYVVLRKRECHSVHHSIALRPYPQIDLVIVVEKHGLVVLQVGLHKVEHFADAELAGHGFACK